MDFIIKLKHLSLHAPSSWGLRLRDTFEISFSEGGCTMGKALQGLMVILVLLGAGLTACNLTAPNCLEMPAPWSAQPEQSYWTSIDGPGTPVTFTWMFSSDCQPDHFRIVMNDIPIIEDYSLVDERITPTSNPPTVIYEDGTTAFAYSWTTPKPLWMVFIGGG